VKDVRAWDVFISHASEDKDDVVLPLAEALRRAGLRVWLDRQELTIGDSLREKIDEGLANSHFGVVVISPAFLEKGWPKKELSGLFALEEVAGRKVILPVWHLVDKVTVSKYSPILADRLAGTTVEGPQALARQLIDVVLSPGGGTISELAPTPLRLLVNHLDGDPGRVDTVRFLSVHPRMVTRALGYARPVAWSAPLGPFVIDLIAATNQYTTDETSYDLVQFGPVTTDVVEGESPADSVRELVAQIEGMRRWIAGNLRAARVSTESRIDGQFQGTVVAGRRQSLSSREQRVLRDYHRQLVGIRVRTYDWLIDSQQTDSMDDPDDR
jgi:TIR domain